MEPTNWIASAFRYATCRDGEPVEYLLKNLEISALLQFKLMLLKGQLYIYSALRKKGILPFVTTWIELEGITLSERSKTEKDKYCMVSLTCGIETKTKEKSTS